MPNDSIGWRDLKTKAMQALESLDIPEKVLVYLRPSADTELPAELCIRDEEGVHNVYGMTPRAMLQVVRVAVEIIQNSKHLQIIIFDVSCAKAMLGSGQGFSLTKLIIYISCFSRKKFKKSIPVSTSTKQVVKPSPTLLSD